ncbi:MAG: MFS transporter [Anaerolineae bacterium]
MAVINKRKTAISPWHVLIPAGLGTALSIIGDASLYTVLPSHTGEAGVSLASLGVLLSANRFIRLALNGPAGLAYERWPRRYLFVMALFIGAISTAIYALTQGFWPLLLGRLLWGLAWAGIWVGGNTIILDISHSGNRGRWVGLYQISFFMGTLSGTLVGGLLTDWLGYHLAMGAGAGLTLLGAMVALIFLPETRRFATTATAVMDSNPHVPSPSRRANRMEFASATALLAVNRMVLAGIFYSTFGLFLLERMGDSIHLGGRALGVATLTGFGLALNSLISMVSAPAIGGLSDRMGNRWRIAAGGLVPGLAGFSLLALGSSPLALIGVPLTAISGGSNQGLSTTLVGDLSGAKRRGRRLGWLFTIGDLASAIGPPLAYNTLIPLFGLNGAYLLSAGLFLSIFLVALGWALKPKPQPPSPAA